MKPTVSVPSPAGFASSDAADEAPVGASSFLLQPWSNKPATSGTRANSVRRGNEANEVLGYWDRRVIIVFSPHLGFCQISRPRRRMQRVALRTNRTEVDAFPKHSRDYRAMPKPHPKFRRRVFHSRAGRLDAVSGRVYGRNRAGGRHGRPGEGHPRRLPQLSLLDLEAE